ncbi:MAG: hypothetical protein SGI72_11965 [Planctomycetota bacterium]|nr:hypothetical protein [Planctomycetota bacterium]
MSDQPKSKRKYVIDFLLAGAGVAVAFESAMIVFVQLGWRERGRGFEESVTLMAPVALVLGVYVAVQASGRMTARKETRDRKLAEFHEKADRARAASKQS